ncbi:MAG: hypothetical protein HYS12_27000 [Planctomycetes bacterium]|nr:hypothetical protein [Planctomycetota bacterium]
MLTTSEINHLRQHTEPPPHVPASQHEIWNPTRSAGTKRPSGAATSPGRSCACSEVEGANLIKIHRRTGKVSYLVYPDFDTDPHPALVRCVRLSLHTRQLDCYDYGHTINPPILYRKETFLHPDHPLYEKFARLTKQEEQHDLLDNAGAVGNRSGWETRLREAGYRLRGHQLVRASRDSRSYS